MRTAIVVAFLALGLSAHADSPVPRPAKELTVKDPSTGKQTLLSSLKGDVVVCQFLFTWCPHCQDFSKLLSKLQTELGPRGFRALGIAFDDGLMDPDGKVADSTKVKIYRQEYAKFPVGIATRATALSYLGIAESERIGVPQIVVIDRKGIIRAQTDAQGGGQLGVESTLRPLIEKLLAEGATGKSGTKAAPAKTSAVKKATE